MPGLNIPFPQVTVGFPGSQPVYSNLAHPSAPSYSNDSYHGHHAHHGHNNQGLYSSIQKSFSDDFFYPNGSKKYESFHKHFYHENGTKAFDGKI